MLASWRDCELQAAAASCQDIGVSTYTKSGSVATNTNLPVPMHRASNTPESVTPVSEYRLPGLLAIVAQTDASANEAVIPIRSCNKFRKSAVQQSLAWIRTTGFEVAVSSSTRHHDW